MPPKVGGAYIKNLATSVFKWLVAAYPTHTLVITEQNKFISIYSVKEGVAQQRVDILKICTVGKSDVFVKGDVIKAGLPQAASEPSVDDICFNLSHESQESIFSKIHLLFNEHCELVNMTEFRVGYNFALSTQKQKKEVPNEKKTAVLEKQVAELTKKLQAVLVYAKKVHNEATTDVPAIVREA
uniref:Uncharacterized protein n=1 Tax=Pyramimonas orientalis virus TaxID=455367 RepID=A0A7M3UPA2_POV01|nr:hypothetical protein HWQ62_00446 [Pyramimonas orientalis virus]